MEQAGEGKATQGDMSDRAWQPVLTLVDGSLTQSDVTAALSGFKFYGVTAIFAGTRFQVTQAGAVNLNIGGTGIQGVWIDGKSVPASATISTSLSQGAHSIVLRCDPRNLPAAIKASSPDAVFLTNF